MSPGCDVHLYLHVVWFVAEVNSFVSQTVHNSPRSLSFLWVTLVSLFFFVLTVSSFTLHMGFHFLQHDLWPAVAWPIWQFSLAFSALDFSLSLNLKQISCFCTLLYEASALSNLGISFSVPGPTWLVSPERQLLWSYLSPHGWKQHASWGWASSHASWGWASSHASWGWAY